MKYAVVLLGLLAAGLGGGVWYLQDANGQLAREAETLREVNYDLMARIDELAREKKELATRLDRRLAEASAEKEAEMSRLRQTYEALVADLKDEIDAGKVRISRLADRLSVRVIDRILFPSGEAGLSDQGRDLLRRVGRILQDNGDRLIRVEGHTDTIPIGKRLSKRYPTNWELSTARATNVVRFLQDEVGVDPGRLQAMGLSQYHPVASNRSRAGRIQNRRIEIRLLPRPADAAGAS